MRTMVPNAGACLTTSFSSITSPGGGGATVKGRARKADTPSTVRALQGRGCRTPWPPCAPSPFARGPPSPAALAAALDPGACADCGRSARRPLPATCGVHTPVVLSTAAGLVVGARASSDRDSARMLDRPAVPAGVTGCVGAIEADVRRARGRLGAAAVGHVLAQGPAEHLLRLRLTHRPVAQRGVPQGLRRQGQAVGPGARTLHDRGARRARVAQRARGPRARAGRHPSDRRDLEVGTRQAAEQRRDGLPLGARRAMGAGCCAARLGHGGAAGPRVPSSARAVRQGRRRGRRIGSEGTGAAQDVLSPPLCRQPRRLCPGHRHRVAWGAQDGAVAHRGGGAVAGAAAVGREPAGPRGAAGDGRGDPPEPAGVVLGRGHVRGHGWSLGRPCVRHSLAGHRRRHARELELPLRRAPDVAQTPLALVRPGELLSVRRHPRGLRASWTLGRR